MLRNDVLGPLGIAQRLGHLAALCLQHAIVDPVVCQVVAIAALRLGNFVFMVRELEVFAAAVDIDHAGIEFLADHDDTLGVPARTSRTPWGIPLDALVGLLPQGKVLRILLEIVGFDSGTGIEIFQTLVRQLAVFRIGFH